MVCSREVKGKDSPEVPATARDTEGSPPSILPSPAGKDQPETVQKN